jgi:hypothetical protein
MGNRSEALLEGIGALLDLAGEARGLKDRLDVNLKYGPFVAGIEVTQSIQYWQASQHLTDWKDRGPDNSVHLCANKPAYARVYLGTNFIRTVENLTGELIVERRTGPLLLDWVPVAKLTPQPPGSAAADPSSTYVTQRSTLGASLNFILTSSMMSGFLRLTARVWKTGDATKSIVDTHQETVDVTMLQTLSLRGIFIAYNGPDPTTTPPTANVVLAAPTVANLQATAAWTLLTNPVESVGVFSSGGTMNWFAPLVGVATTSGGCSTDWLGLNYWISLMKLNDGNRDDVIYYGLLPQAMPIQNVGGCESSGVSAGADTFQVVMAHEVGHGAGLLHAPCPTGLGNADANFPAYEPYDTANVPNASLGEYGLDITNGTIHLPTEKDYMSYCGPPSFTQWISLYHHRLLSVNEKFNPRRVGISHYKPPDLVDPYLWPWEYIPDPPNWQQSPGDMRQKAERLIAITGIAEDGRLDVKSVARVEALRGNTDARRTSFVAQLIGESGDVVASAPVMRLDSRGGGCGCGCEDGGTSSRDTRFLFQALLADSEPGSALRIIDRSADDDERKEVWVRHASASRPRIASFTVKIGRGTGVATWQARAARGSDLEFSLQFSKDRGRSWNGLTVGLTSNTHRFSLVDLPTGSLIFRLLAHDGFYSVTSVSRAVVLPPRPPTVSILHPQEGREVLSGGPMRLWGAVTNHDGTRVDDEACTWRVDGREVARGIDAFIEAPPPGEHLCQLRVRGRDGRAEASVVFRTVDPMSTTGSTQSPRPPRDTPKPRKTRRSRRKKSR